MSRHFKFFVISLVVCSIFLFSACINSVSDYNNTENSLFEPLSDDVSMQPRLIETTGVDDSAEVSKIVSPAVVGISSSDGYRFSVGSGVAVASGGYVLTNNHVITSKEIIKLYLADGSTAEANFIWGDATLDLAILKSNQDLPYLKIAEEANPDVGEYVLAIGTPLQLQFKHSVTKGIVSALNRTVKVTENGLTTAMQSLIQHDASINPGNSGGPLINENSKVIGINTLKIEMAEGIGFAIPASVIKNVLSNVLSDGAYQTAYLGVFGYDASIPYFNNKVSKSNGYYVIDVFEGSPANLAGIKKGDVILSVNEVDVNNMIDFQRELFAYKENDTIKIKYMQGDNVKTVEVTLQAKQQHTSTKLKGNSELPEGSLIEAEQLTSI